MFCRRSGGKGGEAFFPVKYRLSFGVLFTQARSVEIFDRPQSGPCICIGSRRRDGLRENERTVERNGRRNYSRGIRQGSSESGLVAKRKREKEREREREVEGNNEPFVFSNVYLSFRSLARVTSARHRLTFPEEKHVSNLRRSTEPVSLPSIIPARASPHVKFLTGILELGLSRTLLSAEWLINSLFHCWKKMILYVAL